MAKEAKAVLGVKTLKVVADRGYYSGEEIRASELSGIKAYVPKPKTSPNKAKGYFDRSKFRYIKKVDQYECLAGECGFNRSMQHLISDRQVSGSAASQTVCKEGVSTSR